MNCQPFSIHSYSQILRCNIIYSIYFVLLRMFLIFLRIKFVLDYVPHKSQQQLKILRRVEILIFRFSLKSLIFLKNYSALKYVSYFTSFNLNLSERIVIIHISISSTYLTQFIILRRRSKIVFLQKLYWIGIIIALRTMFSNTYLRSIIQWPRLFYYCSFNVSFKLMF